MSKLRIKIYLNQKKAISYAYISKTLIKKEIMFCFI